MMKIQSRPWKELSACSSCVLLCFCDVIYCKWFPVWCKALDFVINFYFILYSENQCISKLDKIGIFIDMKFL